MSREDDLRKFVEDVKADPRKVLYVEDWLTDRPPPEEWEGDPLEWAFAEMPLPLFWLRSSVLLFDRDHGRGENE